MLTAWLIDITVPREIHIEMARRTLKILDRQHRPIKLKLSWNWCTAHLLWVADRAAPVRHRTISQG